MKYRFEILIQGPINYDLPYTPLGYDGSDNRNDAWAFLNHPDEGIKKDNVILVLRDGETESVIAFSYIEKKRGHLRVIPVEESSPSSKSMGWGKFPTNWKKNEKPEYKIQWAAEWKVPIEKIQSCVMEWIEMTAQEFGVNTEIFAKDTISAQLAGWEASNVTRNRKPEHELIQAVYHYYTYGWKFVIHDLQSAYRLAQVPYSEKKYCLILKKHISLIDILLARTIHERFTPDH